MRNVATTWLERLLDARRLPARLPQRADAQDALGHRRVEVILESVDAAITVRDTKGRMVYANQAAADLLRFRDIEALKSSPPGAIMDTFDVYSEAGDPVELDELPGSRLLRGELNPAPITVRNVVKATGEERWLLQKARAVTDDKGRVVLSVSLIEDITATKRNEIAQRLLARTARQAAETSQLSRVFQAIVEEAVPGLADWAGVDILDEAGRIVTAAIAHRDPEKVRLGWRLRTRWPVDAAEPTGIANVIRTGDPDLVPEITDEMLVLGAVDAEHLGVLRAVGLNSTMITPIRAGDRVLGALSFVSSTSRRFDSRDVELACDLGSQLGVIIRNEQLHAEQAHIARTLEAGLIPQSLPAVDGWDISSAYRAAGLGNEVGGDFYDLVRYEGGAAAIIGDVLGKGAEAAALTALARHTVAAIVESTGDIPHALRVLNRRLRERGDDFRSLCTVAVVALTRGPAVTVYSAGHPQPLLAGRDGVREVGTTSPMLGFVDDLDVTPSVVDVGPGERLVLYTDGVLDAVGREGRFGEDGLANVLIGMREGHAPAPMILAAVDRFAAGDQSDDIAILGLTRLAVVAPAPA